MVNSYSKLLLVLPDQIIGKETIRVESAVVRTAFYSATNLMDAGEVRGTFTTPAH